MPPFSVPTAPGGDGLDGSAPSAADPPPTSRVLVSCYTNVDVLAHTPKGQPSAAHSIVGYHVDGAKGLLVPDRSASVGVGDAGDNVAFMVKHPALDVLYASTERIDREGDVLVIKPCADTGALKVTQRVSARGRSTCFIDATFAAAGEAAEGGACEGGGCGAPGAPCEGHGVIKVVNYWDARLAALRVRGDGSVGDATHVLQRPGAEYVDASHPGREEHWAYRQRWPHTHCAVTDPWTGAWTLVCDLGEDAVVVTRVDRGGGRINVAGRVALAKGLGPRHLVFHPSARVAYVVNELESSVSVLSVDLEALERAAGAGGGGSEEEFSHDAMAGESSGGGGAPALRHLQTLSTLPDEWQGRSCIKNGVWKAASHCSEIKVSPCGGFVLAANRGHDSVAVFAVDAATGQLSTSHIAPSGGATPRNFSFTPCGRFVVVGNQDSNNLALFEMCRATGALGLRHTVPCPSPNFVCALPGGALRAQRR